MQGEVLLPNSTFKLECSTILKKEKKMMGNVQHHPTRALPVCLLPLLFFTAKSPYQHCFPFCISCYHFILTLIDLIISSLILNSWPTL